MAVAVVDTGTATYKASATTQNFTFTVSATATLAVFYLAQDATQSITSVTWDQGGTNQACTLVGSKSCPTASHGAVYIYAVVNPTSGTSKTLRVVNGTATGVGAEMQSYSGTETSSVAAACTNVLTANGTTSGTGVAANVGTASQSGVSGDMYVSCYTTDVGAINSVNQTQIYRLLPAGNDSAGNRAASAGSAIALTMNLDNLAADQWCAVSCDIVQPAASTPTGWLSSSPDPIRGPLRGIDGANQYLAYTGAATQGGTFNESVTEDRWHQPWSEPWIKTKSGLLVPLQSYLAFTELIIASGTGNLLWYQPWSVVMCQNIALGTE